MSTMFALGLMNVVAMLAMTVAMFIFEPLNVYLSPASREGRLAKGEGLTDKAQHEERNKSEDGMAVT